MVWCVRALRFDGEMSREGEIGRGLAIGVLVGYTLASYIDQLKGCLDEIRCCEHETGSRGQ